MGEEVKWLLKEGGGLIFECFDISLESTPTLHVVYISTPTTNHLSTLVWNADCDKINAPILSLHADFGIVQHRISRPFAEFLIVKNRF